MARYERWLGISDGSASASTSDVMGGGCATTERTWVSWSIERLAISDGLNRGAAPPPRGLRKLDLGIMSRYQ